MKVLPRDFVSDADRLRRFEQEAKTLAALNHPNIITVFDVGQHEGQPYLVSELLEGQTLREALGSVGNAALPARRAADYALQIAQGLAAAHGKGVVHRDLKPENILVGKDGRVKILDFGLAKLHTATERSTSRNPAPEAAAEAPTLKESTEPGRVMGTPAYMSPEQVRGEASDHRTDIFAFGCIVYEMLSGTRAFRRNTTVESMNAVLNEEPPDLNAVNATVPPPLERLVRRCLEKRPDNRFQSAKDLAFAVENVSGSTSVSARAGLQEKRRLGRLSFRGVVGFGFAILLALGAGLVIGRFRGANPAQPTVRLLLAPSSGYHLSQRADSFALSPDGRNLALSEEGKTNRHLAIRPLAALESRLVPDTPGAKNIFWSPDARSIGFFDGGTLKTVSVEGGRPTSLCKARGAGGTWGKNGSIVFAEFFGSGLSRISASGGEAEPLTTLDSAQG